MSAIVVPARRKKPNPAASMERRAAAVARALEIGVKPAAVEFDMPYKTLHAWREDAGFSKPRGTLLPNAPFRELCLRTIEQEGLRWADLARRMGYTRTGRHQHQCDAKPLLRALGLLPTAPNRRYITYDMAVKIVRACNAYPVDYGI